MRLAVVGNPENRRVALFTSAVLRAGLPEPEVFPWLDVLVSGRVPGPGTLVRIDSPGENAEVDRLLRTLGTRAARDGLTAVSPGGFGSADDGRAGSGPAHFGLAGDRADGFGPASLGPTSDAAGFGSAGGVADGFGSAGGVADGFGLAEDGAVSVAAHGEIVGAAAGFAGLSIALERIAAGGGVLLNQPADILTMTAKPRCHAVLSAAGVPVPPALTAGCGLVADLTADGGAEPSPRSGVEANGGGTVVGYESLRAAMDAAGWSRVFVKAAYGSSASGVIALATGGRRGTEAGRRIMAVTSVELSAGKIYNNLRVRRYDDEASITAIIDRLAPDGLHVERWYPKAALDGRVLDLRVVVIAGRARHVVVRTSRSPMTNLHLGNARGDVSAVRAAAGEQAWAAAMDTCIRAAACFPRTLHAGVDLMFRTGWRDHAVAEVNAFGDLLPRVLSENGHDTYDAQVAALLNGWRPIP